MCSLDFSRSSQSQNLTTLMKDDLHGQGKVRATKKSYQRVDEIHIKTSFTASFSVPSFLTSHIAKIEEVTLKYSYSKRVEPAENSLAYSRRYIRSGLCG